MDRDEQNIGLPCFICFECFSKIPRAIPSRGPRVGRPWVKVMSFSGPSFLTPSMEPY